jgi:RND family efflux transporter MFP subunit
MTGRLRSVLEIGGGIVAAVVTVAWLSGSCGQKIRPGEVEGAEGTAGATGRVVAVERSVEPAVEQASGSIESARHTTVSSKILARIEDVRVRAGSDVKQGDVLVVLDARDLEARAREAREAGASARSQLELATSERNRAEQLQKSGVAPQRDVDRALSAYRVAAAEVERAAQRLRDAEVGLSHAEIRSPVSGRVVDRLAEPGDTAAPGAPLLRVYDPGVLRLEAPVRESLAQHLAVGQRVPVIVEAIGERLEGQIEEIVPQAEPGARTFLVKVRFEPNPRVFAGMFGRLAVPAGERERLRIPEPAVERIGQLAFVTAIGPDGRTERRLVTTGARDAKGHVEVLSGLAAGESVWLAEAAGDPP